VSADNPPADRPPDDGPPHDGPPGGGDVVFRYTRRQAIADGVLIDLTPWAAEVGFVYPLACTAGVWHGHVVPADPARQLGQDERGRAHDLLWVLRCAIRQSRPGPHGFDSHLAFGVSFVTASGRPETVRLVAVCGPGDGGEPVITVMLPGED
jgi:hypothetical protein